MTAMTYLLGCRNLMGFEANDFFFQLIDNSFQRLSGEFACADIRRGFTIQIAEAVFSQLEFSACPGKPTAADSKPFGCAANHRIIVSFGKAFCSTTSPASLT